MDATLSPLQRATQAFYDLAEREDRLRQSLGLLLHKDASGRGLMKTFFLVPGKSHIHLLTFLAFFFLASWP